MPDYLKRVGRDVTDDILVRVPETEKKLARQGGPATKRLSIDRGSIPSVAAPFEGQMMIQYADEAVGSTAVSPDVGDTFIGEQPYYFSNQEWRPFASGIALNAQTEWLEVTSTSVSGISTGTLTLSHLSGPALVTSGAVTTRGVYTIDAVCLAISNASSRNKFQFLLNMVQTAFTAATFAQDVYSDVLADTPEGTISITGVMDIGDTFLLQVFNEDTGSRNFSCPSVRVTRILDLS